MSGDNLNRLRAAELIALLPGIHLRRLSRILGLQLSTTSYHVSHLEKEGRIICSRDGEFLRSYPLSMNDELERRTYALLQYKPAREILKLLLRESNSNPGETNGELSAHLGLSESTISRYVGYLRQLELVSKVPGRGGRWVLKVEPDDRPRLNVLVSRLERNFLSAASDNYLDLWSF